ncbi:alpha/beta fold hydrolase [Hymenobacter sp. BRD67]|uniref:alpha/beta fold hydrolase n=1 Tax=Hymenobacter sp. BRD67 TaxID=2675877 RepID=UPI001567949C|nr:alpha/beta hydrolase [Hymenobacter sp. BRD67]QKG51881.1 alpha/beta hydrolase [Hymenobacter sp. BRD67]
MFTSLLSRWIFVLALVLALPASRLAAQPAPAAHPTFEVRVVGKGQPVILIPGLTCPGAVWNETVARYQGQYQCHVISLAGFGGVAPQQPVSGHLLQDTRDQLLAYIKAQQLRRPVVIGHSLGGFLALWMAATDPTALGPLEIVDSLPFLSAIQNPATTAESARPQAEQLRQQMSKGRLPLAAERQLVAGMVTDTARITQVARWGLASDPATVAQAMYDMYVTDLRADLARIQQPVLVLGTWAAYKAYGATKESTRAIFTQQYAKLPTARIELSEAGRHFVMYDDTAWFFAQTDGFLKQRRVATR